MRKLTSLLTAVSLLGLLPLAHSQIVYVGSSSSSVSVQKIDLDGNKSLFGSGLGPTLTLTLDQQENLYVGDGGIIYKYTPQGQRTTFTSSGTSGVRGLAFGPDGNLYAGNNGGGYIGYYNPSGSFLGVYAGASGVTSLAFSPGGDLFYVSGNSVYRTGQGTAFAGGFSSPQDLTFDLSGNLYVTSSGNNSIYKVTPDGQTSIFANITTVPDLGAPSGIQYLDGLLYVANSGKGNVLEIDVTDLSYRKLADGITGANGLAVPEPSSLALLLIGAGALLVRGRRRN
ncbi:MAG TPA: PEP-CTERM sorting domain-containing protein [Clostridia bacterium]|nr:PEP-CTERM sorting domain-containing protein [Clostridia bacterium]